jgi:hypothetical protein
MTKDEFYFWTTVATMTISICALGLSIWNGYQTRYHNKLAVKPYLKFVTVRHEGLFEFKLCNKGLGPAEIESFDVLIENVVTDVKGIKCFVESFCKSRNLVFNEVPKVAKLGKGMLMLPNEMVTIMKVSVTNNPISPIGDLLNNIFGAKVKYNSLYGDEFKETRGNC